MPGSPVPNRTPHAARSRPALRVLKPCIYRLPGSAHSSAARSRPALRVLKLVRLIMGRLYVDCGKVSTRFEGTETQPVQDTGTPFCWAARSRPALRVLKHCLACFFHTWKMSGKV